MKELSNLCYLDGVLYCLADEYIKDGKVVEGVISKEWLKRIGNELKIDEAFKEKDVYYLRNLRHLIVLSLGQLITSNRLSNNNIWLKYNDCMSAFVAVIDDTLFQLGAL